MAIRTILHYPDPRLRNKGQPIAEVTAELRALIDDMAETMYAAPGVGLAAPQIGEPYRLFLIDIAGEEEPSNLQVFINPEITEKNGDQKWEEGCLSFPGVTEEIARACTVTVKALDQHGKAFEVSADGLLAVAIQHEYDHLEGVLMIDHVGPLKKRMMAKKVQKHSQKRK